MEVSGLLKRAVQFGVEGFQSKLLGSGEGRAGPKRVRANCVAGPEWAKTELPFEL